MRQLWECDTTAREAHPSEGVVQGEETRERKMNDTYVRAREGRERGEAEMEENTERNVKCEKSVERGLEKRVEGLGACSYARNLEVFLL